MKSFALITQGRLAKPIMDGFCDNGCKIVQQSNESTWDSNGFDYLLFYGPMAPIREEIRRLRSDRSIPPVVFWYTEQMPFPGIPTWWVAILARFRFAVQKGYDEILCRWVSTLSNRRARLPAMGRLRGIGEMLALQETGCLRLICAFTKTNARFLSKLDLPAVELPIGYHPHFGERMSVSRDIDVVFLGTRRDSRRKKWIGRLENELEEWGIRFVIRDGSLEHGYSFDHARTILLNRTRIMINIMRQPWDDPVYRFLLAAPNGVLLLSESIWEDSRGLFQPGEHYIECNLNDMVDNVREFLSNEAERQLIVDRAHAFATNEMTMSKMVGRFLELL